MNAIPHELHLVRHFPATPEQVFDAWLVPRTLGRWAFGPALGCGALERLNLDPREGGQLSLQLRSAQSVQVLCGSYRQIERPHRLSFVLASCATEFQDTVQLHLASSTEGCTLQLLHTSTRTDAGAAELQTDWGRLLDALSALFTLNPKEPMP